jgi:hypothetical protein
MDLPTVRPAGGRVSSYTAPAMLYLESTRGLGILPGADRAAGAGRYRVTVILKPRCCNMGSTTQVFPVLAAALRGGVGPTARGPGEPRLLSGPVRAHSPSVPSGARGPSAMRSESSAACSRQPSAFPHRNAAVISKRTPLQPFALRSPVPKRPPAAGLPAPAWRRGFGDGLVPLARGGGVISTPPCLVSMGNRE